MHLPGLTRREIGSFVTAAALQFAAPATAYDALPEVDGLSAELEKKRKERAAMIEKNKAKIKPYLDAIAAATDQTSFAAATDSLSVYIIGEGRLPEGVEPPRVRDVIVDAYKSLPLTVRYTKREAAPPGLPPCEETRTNGGVCYSPGAVAEDSLKTSLKELRKVAASRSGYVAGSGKGALISDGVSAANSAAF